MKTYAFSSIIVFFLIAAQCTESTTSQPCIDESKINPNGICTMEYDPVCGCDGKIYGNKCQAINAGVTSWESGECK